MKSASLVVAVSFLLLASGCFSHSSSSASASQSESAAQTGHYEITREKAAELYTEAMVNFAQSKKPQVVEDALNGMQGKVLPDFLKYLREKWDTEKQAEGISMAPSKAPADSTLLGYDLSLNLARFKTTYAQKIRSCAPGKYTGDDPTVAEEFGVPIVHCMLKDGADVKFSAAEKPDYEIYELYRDYQEDREPIKLRVAAEKFATKVNRDDLTYETYADLPDAGFGVRSAFYHGRVSIIATGISDQGTGLSTDVVLNVANLRFVFYRNLLLEGKMTQELQRKKAKAEDKQGAALNL